MEKLDWINLVQHKKKVAGFCECGNKPYFEICPVLGYYAAYSSNFLPSSRSNGPILRGHEIQEESLSSARHLIQPLYLLQFVTLHLTYI
jgi:hypothetical protein